MAVTTPEFKPAVQNNDAYKASTYPSKTPQEARQYIKELLDGRNFAIAVSPTIATQLTSAAGSSTDNIQSLMKVAGVVHVNTIVEDSEYHSAIRSGQPVCFEVKYGKYLTGVKSSWGVDEYHIVGTAMADNTSGIKRIPVLLNRYEKGSSLSVGNFVCYTPSGVPARVSTTLGFGYVKKCDVAIDGIITVLDDVIGVYNPGSEAVSSGKYIVTIKESRTDREIVIFEDCGE